MVSPVKEFSSPPQPPQGQPSHAESDYTLAELRDSVAGIAKEVAAIAERRTRAARTAAVDAAETGVSEVRSIVRNQPILAVAVAAAAGALVAIAVAGARSSRPASRWDKWTPNITRADFHDFADNIQRSVSRAASAAAAPVTPAFERMVDALSRADTSSVNTIIDKMGGWFQKAQDKAKEKMR